MRKMLVMLNGRVRDDLAAAAIQCRVSPVRSPGEGWDPFPRWAPVFAGVASFLEVASSGVDECILSMDLETSLNGFGN